MYMYHDVSRDYMYNNMCDKSILRGAFKGNWLHMQGRQFCQKKFAFLVKRGLD